MSCVIGLDIGTTSTIGILIRMPGERLALASRPVTLSHRHAGWAEEDPQQWWDNVCAIIPQLLAQAGVAASEVKAVGVSGMVPAVVLLDANGALLRPSIQQSDGRCAQEVQALRRQFDEAAFTQRTGNGINQQLVAAKLLWVARHEPQVFDRIHTVLGSYDYINFRLTGARHVEQNWALEAGFVDLASGQIAADLIELILDLVDCGVDVLADLELDHRLAGAFGCRGTDRLHPGDRPDRRFDALRDLGFDLARCGAGLSDRHDHHREFDVRVLLDLHLHEADHAKQNQRGEQHQRNYRVADRPSGDVAEVHVWSAAAQRAAALAAIARGTTVSPG